MVRLAITPEALRLILRRFASDPAQNPSVLSFTPNGDMGLAAKKYSRRRTQLGRVQTDAHWVNLFHQAVEFATEKLQR